MAGLAVVCVTSWSRTDWRRNWRIVVIALPTIIGHEKSSARESRGLNRIELGIFGLGLDGLSVHRAPVTGDLITTGNDGQATIDFSNIASDCVRHPSRLISLFASPEQPSSNHCHENLPSSLFHEFQTHRHSNGIVVIEMFCPPGSKHHTYPTINL